MFMYYNNNTNFKKRPKEIWLYGLDDDDDINKTTIGKTIKYSRQKCVPPKIQGKNSLFLSEWQL